MCWHSVCCHIEEFIRYLPPLEEPTCDVWTDWYYFCVFVCVMMTLMKDPDTTVSPAGCAVWLWRSWWFWGSWTESWAPSSSQWRSRWDPALIRKPAARNTPTQNSTQKYWAQESLHCESLSDQILCCKSSNTNIFNATRWLKHEWNQVGRTLQLLVWLSWF